jgi:hypothetical protein
VPVIITADSNDAHLREMSMPWSSYKGAAPPEAPAPEPEPRIAKTLPEDLLSDYEELDSLVMLGKQRLFDWLIEFFDFTQPNKDGSDFNFNRVEHTMHLLVTNEVSSLEEFFQLYLDSHDASGIYDKYFGKLPPPAAKDHDEHHTSVYEGDLRAARERELLLKAKNERGLTYLVETMRLHVPAVYVCLPPVIKFDDLPGVLEGDLDCTRATHENCVLFSICPVLVTADSTLQEIALALQLCIQFASMSPLVSGAGASANAWQTDARSPSRVAPMDAVSSKVIVSSVPTLSLKHPINVRLAKLQSRSTFLFLQLSFRVVNLMIWFCFAYRKRCFATLRIRVCGQERCAAAPAHGRAIGFPGAGRDDRSTLSHRQPAPPGRGVKAEVYSSSRVQL